MAKIWDTPFPTLSMKLVALKLADCGHDDGESIYPSIERVARETGCSASTVNEVIADFEAAGLLIVVKQGVGNRRGHSSTIRKMSLSTLDRMVGGSLMWAAAQRPVRDTRGALKTDAKTKEAKTRKSWRLEAAPATTDGAAPPDVGGAPETAAPPGTGGAPLRGSETAPPDAGFCPSGARRLTIIEPSEVNHHARAGAGEPMARPAREVKAIKKAILKAIGQDRYDSWIACCDISMRNAHTVRIETSQKFIASYIGSHYQLIIEQAARKVLGTKVIVDISCSSKLLKVVG